MKYNPGDVVRFTAETEKTFGIKGTATIESYQGFGNYYLKEFDYLVPNCWFTLETIKNDISQVVEKEDLGKHYRFSFKGIKVDVYRILEIFQITNPAQQHAIKKLLRAGKSIKPLSQDIDEVILTLKRWQEMIQEENE